MKDILTRAYQNDNNSTYINRQKSIWVANSNQLFVLLISVAGYVLGIVLMGIERYDRSVIQCFSFLAASMLYVFSIPFCQYSDVNTVEFSILFVLTLIRYVVLDAGPNTTTFVCGAALASPTTPGLVFGIVSGTGTRTHVFLLTHVFTHSCHLLIHRKTRCCFWIFDSTNRMRCKG